MAENKHSGQGADNSHIVGASPAVALGTLYQTAAHSLSIMMENSVHSQNNQFILGEATLAAGIHKMYSVDVVATSVTISQLLQD